ncbi:GNAT family N-acetyltransferase [Paracoccus marinaquae]|uniref:GNAT family N-acetyltransferase n=1 Tax=Paracoccus marinaquae TaxID=2841926 RepID=A0ABS6AH35_9RHOB|nr:GNAT family N-acetyltransferase [Paracoccus marinaquae]MBU3029903.1 GNAT family N-acetyltransferase [Paracoccus marinaquae]
MHLHYLSRHADGPPHGTDLSPAHLGKLRLRGLTARDRRLHTAHLLRLSAEDRRARFHSAISDKAVIAYSRGLDWNHAWVFGAFVDGTLRGVGELVPLEGTDEGELSISVEKPYQHMGIGKMLTLALILAARRTGIGTVRMLYVHGNQRMRALARDLGAKTIAAPGVLEGVVTVAEKPRRPA